MTSIDCIKYITELAAVASIAEAKLADKERNSIDASRFYAVAMTTEEVAKFHGISPARVRDYASRGLIELHPNSTDSKMLFRASYALCLDFAKLKREKYLQKL